MAGQGSVAAIGDKADLTTVTDALAQGAARLAAVGVECARLEARRLLAHALGWDAAQLIRARDELVDPRHYRALLARRVAREPLALIIGTHEFWSLEFAVSPATLIPRADSEALVAAALAALPDRGQVRRVLDLGTGTGCLLLACLSEFPAAWGVGVDKVAAAAALAAANAARLGLAGRASFLVGDWSAPLAEKFDLILCNPPYIESAAIAGLMPEVALHEPSSALDGGPDGLVCYARVLGCLPNLLREGGRAVLELGAGQAAAVADLAGRNGLKTLAIHADLAGIARALVLGG